MVQNLIPIGGICAQISQEGRLWKLNDSEVRWRTPQKLRANKILAAQPEWDRLDEQKPRDRQKKREKANNLGMTVNVDGRTNAQRAMSNAEEKRNSAENECIERGEDARQSTKAKNDDERMREIWAHNLKARWASMCECLIYFRPLTTNIYAENLWNLAET